jgi:NAD(P)-dependent dehydrogenase (short-subunit alcohol dehydrogenase family)
MLMSVIEGARTAPAYPELVGKRVLVTGVSSACGVDVARAFANHRVRLILQFAEESEAMQTVAELVAPAALDVEVYGPIGQDTDGVVQFSRTVAQSFGRLDTVINLVPLDGARLDAAADAAGIERKVAERLLLPFLLSKIAANRMSLCYADGLVLNIATLATLRWGPEGAFAAVGKSALSAMTRAQAQEWAPRGIRFNAIAPQTIGLPESGGLSGEPDIAALALYLASDRGKALSGHIFEAEPLRS